MGVACYDALGNLRPGIQLVGIEVTQFEAGDEQASQTTVEVSLFDVTPLDRCRQVLVFRTALHIRTCQHGLCRGLCVILRGIVPSGQEVAYSTAVAGDQSFKSPFIAQDLLLVACL